MERTSNELFKYVQAQTKYIRKHKRSDALFINEYIIHGVIINTSCVWLQSAEEFVSNTNSQACIVSYIIYTIHFEREMAITTRPDQWCNLSKWRPVALGLAHFKSTVPVPFPLCRFMCFVKEPHTSATPWIVVSCQSLCGVPTHQLGRSVLGDILSWSWGRSPCQRPLGLREGWSWATGGTGRAARRVPGLPTSQSPGAERRGCPGGKCLLWIPAETGWNENGDQSLWFPPNVQAQYKISFCQTVFLFLRS